MPVSRSLRRLLRIRDIEEEQHRLSLEAAVSESRAMETAIIASRCREHEGRKMIDAGVISGDVTDVQSGRLESDAGRSAATIIVPQKIASEHRVTALREALREKQIQYRQAETLIEEALDMDAIKSVRYSQKSLDDWFRSRNFRGVSCGPTKRAQEEDRDTDPAQRSETPVMSKEKKGR